MTLNKFNIYNYLLHENKIILLDYPIFLNINNIFYLVYKIIIK